MTTMSISAAMKTSRRTKRGPDDTTDHENSRAINGVPPGDGVYREDNASSVRENPDETSFRRRRLSGTPAGEWVSGTIHSGDLAPQQESGSWDSVDR
jgi:hypothetical protein